MNLHLANGVSERIRAQYAAADDLKNHSQLSAIDKGRELERIPFSRSREIVIDWDKVVSDDAGSGSAYVAGLEPQGTEYLRRELETRWGFPDGPKSDADVVAIAEFNVAVDPPLTIFTSEGSRRYMLTLKRDASYELGGVPPAFSTLVQYNEFWNDVESVRSLDSEPTEMSTIDLAPALIYRQYRELRVLQKLGDSLATQAEKISARELDAFIDQDELDRLTSGYMRMRSIQIDVEMKLERLRDKARDLGYYLALSKEQLKLPDGSVDELQPGEIYQPYLTEFRWSTVQHRRVLIRTRSLFFRSSWTLKVPYTVQLSRQIVRYQKIVPDFDPWIEKEKELSDAGFSVFRFERVGTNYVTLDGESIRQIVERCEVDVSFGKRCAVMIPVYEQSLVGGEVLSRYIVIKKPRKGVQPVHLPRLFIEEDLLFSTHFDRVEVGELVQSINLAPGEKREIVIEKSTLTEAETRRTATSISDLTETDRVDLSTEMEKEASTSNERTTTKSLSAKAGGSYGGFSGSASGSTSSTQTTRQFARDLQKVATKASRSVTRQTRQEVKTESSVKSNVTTRESTKIAIENINDGTTLNLLFYQLYNVYQLSLRLERMSFTVLSGREIIAGSGIVLPEVYSLGELGLAIEQMNLAGFPLTPNATTFPRNSETEAQAAYFKTLIDSIKHTLSSEYKDGTGPQSSNSIEVGPWDPQNNNPSVGDFVNSLVDALNAVRYTANRIYPTATEAPASLIVGSPGLYLDAHVGAREATEPYSESMRQAELGKRVAEVREIDARAEYNLAMARRLSRSDPGNTVTGRALDLRTLELTFLNKPLHGDWSLLVAGAFIQDFVIASDDLVQEIAFATDQTWLDQSKGEIALMVHKTMKQELSFLI